MTATTQTLTTTDGVRLSFTDEGAGAPVLLLHGFSSRSAHWAFQRPALLDAGRRVIALDLRSHGESELTDQGLRMSRFAQDVRELIERLGLDELDVVAHSMGVSVALAYVGLYGTDRLRSLTLIDQSAKILNDDTWAWGVRGLTWPNLWEAVNRRVPWGDASLEPTMPESAVEMFLSTGGLTDFPVDIDRAILLEHFSADWRDVVGRIDLPTWVVTSTGSPSFPIEGFRWMVDAIPGSTLTVFERSGHCPHWNEPEQFNRELLGHLERAAG
jgi:non-heme chloroperoxidase